jgi:hypothetical protein
MAQASEETRLPTGSFPNQPPFALTEVLGKER